MRYRPATADDTQAIATLHAESWRATYRGAYSDEFLDGNVHENRMEVWGARLTAPDRSQFVVVAEDEGRIVGFACAYGARDPEFGTLLDNIHVRGEGHRRGIGTGLVRAVAAWCRRNYPECGLYLWVLEQNTNAQRFYARLGATDRGGGITEPPDGGLIKTRRYAWSLLSDVAPSSG